MMVQNVFIVKVKLFSKMHNRLSFRGDLMLIRIRMDQRWKRIDYCSRENMAPLSIVGLICNTRILLNVFAFALKTFSSMFLNEHDNSINVSVYIFLFIYCSSLRWRTRTLLMYFNNRQEVAVLKWNTYSQKNTHTIIFMLYLLICFNPLPPPPTVLV